MSEIGVGTKRRTRRIRRNWSGVERQPPSATRGDQTSREREREREQTDTDDKKTTDRQTRRQTGESARLSRDTAIRVPLQKLCVPPSVEGDGDVLPTDCPPRRLSARRFCRLPLLASSSLSTVAPQRPPPRVGGDRGATATSVMRGTTTTTTTTTLALSLSTVAAAAAASRVRAMMLVVMMAARDASAAARQRTRAVCYTNGRT